MFENDVNVMDEVMEPAVEAEVASIDEDDVTSGIDWTLKDVLIVAGISIVATKVAPKIFDGVKFVGGMIGSGVKKMFNKSKDDDDDIFDDDDATPQGAAQQTATDAQTNTEQK